MYFYQYIINAAGLCLTFAFDDLSFKAVASQSSTNPALQNLYEASNAVDRNTSTCTRAEQIGPNTIHKTVWWKVNLGGVYNIYSITILFKNYENYEHRQRGRLAGFSIYVSNTGDVQGANLCYKDGSELPPLNFTIECTYSGRFVIFYNERFDGVEYPTGYQLDNVFTELCEVIVTGCKQSGVYGSNCDIPCPAACKGNTCHIQSGACWECESGVYGSYCNLSCPTNCKNNTCHTQNGKCFTCKPGWTGVYCDIKCTEGWYGDHCVQKCSGHCRDNNTCNHVTGQCDRGCDVGWTGTSCEQECEDGTYGDGCNKKCSGHCLDNSPCNKQTGHCNEGCNPGYTDSYCSRKCNHGYFGPHCSDHCSNHCKNKEPCDHVSGECPDGCQDGYMEVYCNRSCKAGFFGKNCSSPCYPNCNWTCNHIDGTFNHIDGTCGYFKEGLTSYYSKECDGSSSSSCCIGLSISLVINLISIIGVCLLCRGIHAKKVYISGDFLCSNQSTYYTGSDAKTTENSTYQELDLSKEEIQYQNTTVR